jgi:SHS2 domain-containing protein
MPLLGLPGRSNPGDQHAGRIDRGLHAPRAEAVEHASEVELELAAADETGIFAAALAAFSALVMSAGRAQLPTRRMIELNGQDRGLLLVDWLNELLYLSEVEQFVPVELVSVELTRDSLRATVDGHIGTPRPIVKGVTLTELRFTREGGDWHGHVVLDV